MIDRALFFGHEDGKIISYNEIDKNFPQTVAYADLHDTIRPGVLKANHYVNGELIQTYTERENHVAIIAATRLGKSTSYVVPTVVSNSRQKVKKSMIISDPKGEIYRQTAETLREEGYRVLLVNFRDYRHSECWNPLTPIYRKFQEVYKVYDRIRIVSTANGYRNELDGIVYETQAELDEIVELYIRRGLDEVGNDIDVLANLFLATHNTRDPYWEDSARDFFKAFLWAMLEDSRETAYSRVKNLITEDNYSISTMLDIFDTMRDEGKGSRFEDKGYFRNRDVESRAYKLSDNAIFRNGDVTRMCITSTFITRMGFFRNQTIRLLTCCNSFEMKELVNGDQPVAVFIDYRDEEKFCYRLISLFVGNAYTELIDYANQQPSGTLDAPFYFILDEFGNFPQIKDFETTISACGGRNIYFMLVLQSYAQLEGVYGPNVAEVIRDNLNVHVFLGSNNPKTLKEFSEECGYTTRISPRSALSGGGSDIDSYQMETIPLVPRSRLTHFEPGECIVTEANSGYTLWSKLERYFLCPEMRDLPKANVSDYVASCNPYDKRYLYKYAEKTESKSKPKYSFDF